MSTKHTNRVSPKSFFEPYKLITKQDQILIPPSLSVLSLSLQRRVVRNRRKNNFWTEGALLDLANLRRDCLYGCQNMHVFCLHFSINHPLCSKRVPGLCNLWRTISTKADNLLLCLLILHFKLKNKQKTPHNHKLKTPDFYQATLQGNNPISKWRLL